LTNLSFDNVSLAAVLEYLFENANDAIYVLDLHGNIVAVNRKAEELTGFRYQDFIGKSFRKIIPLKSLPKAMSGFLSVIRGKSIRLELELRTASEKTIPVEITSAPLIINGKIVGTFGFVRDITQRVLMENKLRDANKKLETLLETAMEGIVTGDPDENTTFANKAFADMLGYQEDELIGMNLRKLVDEEGFKTIRRQTETRKKGKTSRYELVMYRKDGEPRIFQVSASPLWNEDGSFAGTIGICLDITERKRMEEALQNSEEKFRAMTTSAKDAIVMADSNGRISHWNRAAENIFGYTKEEALGKEMLKLITSNRFHEDFLRGFQNFIETGQGSFVGKTLELPFIRKDGTEFPVELSISAFQMKGEWYAVGILRDITERKKIEEALMESEEKYKSLFENANDALVYGDLAGKILDINRKAEEIAGKKREEILGKHFSRLGLVSLRNVPMIIGRLASRVSGKPMPSFELTINRKGGEKRFIEVNATTIRKHKVPVGFLAVVRDVTERRKMEQKLKEYAEHLEEKVEERTKELKEAQGRLLKAERLAAIGEVAAMIGHDLRNPLTGIAGAAYYLKTKLGAIMDEKAREMLKVIEKDIEHSNQIITDLLDYSREIRLELTKTTAKSIVKEALSLVKVPNNIQIADTTENKPTINVDTAKIIRVFINIVKNAFDAMPEGGKLEIESKQTNGNLQITFTDTGTGMSKEVMENIWAPFFTTKAQGMGLGLPICKRIVEAHKGNISVESTVGKGTTFTVTIPIKTELRGGEKIWVNAPEFLLSTTTKA
jgi:PAS domain S-box-containing protein